MDILDSQRGWVSLDPTHDREQTEAYVRVAVGRDYADVPPTRGVFKGTAAETLDVAVRRSRSVSERLGSELDGWRVEEYGRSRGDLPLQVFLPEDDGPPAGLLTAAQHGEEADAGPARPPAAGAGSRAPRRAGP